MKLWLKALLVLNLEILLLVPQCTFQRLDHGLKSNDQYWAETGLTAEDLESLLQSDNCQSGQQMFLACVNSIQNMAARSDQMLMADGTLQDLEKETAINNDSEKTTISPWVELFRESNASRQIDFLELWKQLENQAMPSQRSALIAAGINGFLSIFKDPHTYILPIAMYEEVIASSEARTANAGFMARKNKNGWVVRKVFDGSSAAQAGLKKGDLILAINGRSVSEMEGADIGEALKMKEISRMVLAIKRMDRQFHVEVFKTEQVYANVTSKMSIQRNNRIGLLTIHKFSKDICTQVRNEVVSLIEQNVQGIVMDLRDNPGGQVDEAACVASLFVEQGTYLFQTKYLDPSKNSDYYVADQEQLYRGPLAILINSGSASAAEIVAGSLRDLSRARLVGERTFGKGTFQDGRVWGQNAKIAYFETQGMYYFPSGWTPQLVGLEPDLAVKFIDEGVLREEDLYMNPILPLDNWGGPQTLSWLTEKDCSTESLSILSVSEDPQVEKAEALLGCRGSKHGYNGSL